ncbi:hypothetical protein GCM10027456_78570 [Kineosporia babensis]
MPKASITDTGWWGPVPVIYVQWTKAETRSIQSALADGGVGVAAGAVCSLIPNTAGRVACTALIASKYSDAKNNADAAVREGKCLKARVPLNAGAIAYPALDFYRHSC